MIVLFLADQLCVGQTNDEQKRRVIILTDVENEPDDTESLVRLLLYSGLPDIKGIIATTSVHMKKEVHPESVRKVIYACGRVQPYLAKHEAGFPAADSLSLLVKQGLPEYGPPGALYPDVAYGMEGDTPSWLFLIPNGLNDPEHPDQGGWDGRYELSRPETAHFILKVTDKGNPPLTRYKRVIVNILP